jgi:hypothetical protein
MFVVKSVKMLPHCVTIISRESLLQYLELHVSVEFFLGFIMSIILFFSKNILSSIKINKILKNKHVCS